jgi:hypothetical protein
MKFLRRFLHADSLRRVANFASETKTRVIPSGARDLTKTVSHSSNVARDLLNRVRIREVLHCLRGSG